MPCLLRTITIARLTFSHCRAFSSSISRQKNRAVIYGDNGDPLKVLRVVTLPPLPPPAAKSVNIRYLLSPVNPADINVIQGVYPFKPEPRYGIAGGNEPVYIAGNEGLAEVREVGEGVQGLQTGDWVVMIKSQAGTWAANANVGEGDVIRVEREQGDGLSEVHAATMTVNPPTAYNMLREFVELKPGDWIIQNGANSAVGQAVIQIAAQKGLKSLNLVRNREAQDDIDALKSYLTSLGATHVLTFDELEDKKTKLKVKEWTQGANIRLGLNCVSGQPTARMASLLGEHAHLVSYGAMSKQPLTLSTGLFIFKNLTAHGFWQTRWYKTKSREEREELLRSLAKMMAEGKLKEPDHEIVHVPAGVSDEAAARVIKDVMETLDQGRVGKKLLLKFNED